MRISDWSSDVCSSDLARMRAGEGSAALGKAIAVDPSFFAVSPSRLVARTYLTYGWRYKGRTLRNRLPDIFKFEIFRHQYPRYVWVTEFSLPDDLRGFDQCQRKVRAHVVVDATRSEEHTSELQSLMRNSYAVFCLKKTKTTNACT